MRDDGSVEWNVSRKLMVADAGRRCTRPGSPPPRSGTRPSSVERHSVVERAAVRGEGRRLPPAARRGRSATGTTHGILLSDTGALVARSNAAGYLLIPSGRERSSGVWVPLGAFRPGHQCPCSCLHLPAARVVAFHVCPLRARPSLLEVYCGR